MVTFWSQPSDRDLRQLPDIPMLREGFLESGHGIVLIHQVEVRVEVEGDATLAWPSIAEIVFTGTRARPSIVA